MIRSSLADSSLDSASVWTLPMVRKWVPQKLTSSHLREADTKIILHCLHVHLIKTITRHGFTYSCLLHIMQNVEQTLLFNTSVGNQRQLMDLNEVIEEVGAEMCHALSTLYAFSGCDTASAFVRKAESTHLKVLKQNQQYLDAICSLGRSA